VAGAVPLLPYVMPIAADFRFTASVGMTMLTLFVVGSLRSLVTVDRWWTAGLEMLLLGILVAAAAYGSGALVATLAGA
jgi:VIT1/CCC1 family predicted Fe2+/Mn2+ transporter